MGKEKSLEAASTHKPMNNNNKILVVFTLPSEREMLDARERESVVVCQCRSMASMRV